MAARGPQNGRQGLERGVSTIFFFLNPSLLIPFHYTAFPAWVGSKTFHVENNSFILFPLRYNTDNIKEKVVEGKLGYLVQSQLERARLRRPPQSMMSIRQAFDEHKFNFNKIDESRELVCQLINKDRREEQRDILIINVSPVGRGHCLLVPQVGAGLQQV